MVVDYSNQKFNYLTAIIFIEYSADKKKAFWLFKCDCGVEKILNLYEVKRGNIKSCGCMKNIHNENKKAERFYFTCPICGKKAYKRQSEIQLTNYCSKKCYQSTLNKSQYITKGEITKIIIPNKTKGEVVAFIDTKNLDKVKPFSWALERNNYVSHRGRRVYIKLHRLITNCPDDMQVDHMDGNPLNNLESNLRICTPSENMQNKPKINKHNKSCGIKNITWDKKRNKWVVYIAVDGNSKSIGRFNNLEDAKIAAQEAREKYHPFFINTRQ